MTQNPNQYYSFTKTGQLIVIFNEFLYISCFQMMVINSQETYRESENIANFLIVGTPAYIKCKVQGNKLCCEDTGFACDP